MIPARFSKDENSDEELEYETGLYDIMAGIKDSDRVEEQVISSTIMINRDLPGSKRNIKLSELADIITSSTPTLVMESALFVYDNDHGFYKKVENAELYVEKNLDHNICSRLDTKQIKEIIAKIRRNPHIQIKADVFNSNDSVIKKPRDEL